MVVGPPNISRRRLTRDDLEELTWISREEGSATRAIADNALADLGIIPRRRLALPAWELIKIAVRAGTASQLSVGTPCKRSLRPACLVEIPFGSWRVRRMFSLIRIRDASLTPAAQEFANALRIHCRALAPAPQLRKTRRSLPGRS